MNESTENNIDHLRHTSAHPRSGGVHLISDPVGKMGRRRRILHFALLDHPDSVRLHRSSGRDRADTEQEAQVIVCNDSGHRRARTQRASRASLYLYVHHFSLIKLKTALYKPPVS